MTEQGWQPIKTAPRDGTIIDVWLGEDDAEDIAFYCGPSGTRRSVDWAWSRDKFRPVTGLHMAVFVVPTHWRPLPEPP